MNESEVRKWTEEATRKIKKVVSDVATPGQLREIEQIMEQLRRDLLKR